MLKTWKFKGILKPTGWLVPGYVHIGKDGKIVSVSDKNQHPELKIDEVNGYAFPGFQNAHSHAFQYAMAGLAEIHPKGAGAGDFWSWREAMFGVALKVGPEALRAIATMLYREMLAHGYTQVVEFHYLHHDSGGNGYSNPAEIGIQLMEAAHVAGIRITLVPVYYHMGGFGKPAGPKQKRFISPDVGAYARLLEAADNHAHNNLEMAKTGYGIHSLRAVDPEEVHDIIGLRDSTYPFHIHVAEQKLEVEEALEHLGKRPVEWLLDHADPRQNFHLVHATHLAEEEVQGIAGCGAHVVLCPSTEGNLGDGIFPLRDYLGAKGAWSIGTDSHIGLCPMEELRWLDYGQRLTTHKRDVFLTGGGQDSGLEAIKMTWKGGRAAAGFEDKSFLETGSDFDAVVMDANHPLIQDSSPELLTASIIYSGDRDWVLGTIVNGIMRYQKSEEKNTAISSQFSKAIKSLSIR